MNVSCAVKLSDKTTPDSDYDRAKELKAFDETKTGVKGLLDAGIKNVPRIFIRPPDEIANELECPNVQLQVPVIDLAGIQGDQHKEIVEQVRDASKTWGFFQVVNHGIPYDVLEEMIQGVRAFHEQEVEFKKENYSRDEKKQVKFQTNYDLYYSKTANWRDTLKISTLSSGQNLNPDQFPAVCRDVTVTYIKHMQSLVENLFGLLSEALGLESGYLQGLDCHKGQTFVFHYYPDCPEPELTLGISKHQDPSFLTIVLQNQIGGLQVLHQNQWVNVQPMQGALVVNIGDFLQVVSNDKFKSVAHRVVSNRVGPRISVASFFSGQMIPPKLYGPIKEILSEENRQIYRDFLISEHVSSFVVEPLDHNSRLDRFKI